MDNQALFAQRLDRIQTAVALGKPDRVPIIPASIAFAAKYNNITLAEFLSNPDRTHGYMLKAYQGMGDIDGVQEAFFTAPILSTLWFSKVKLPGKELKETELWQVSEEELMTEADYDTIIEKGFMPVMGDFFTQRLGVNLFEHLGDLMPRVPGYIGNFVQAGLVPFWAGIFTVPFEIFCGGRSMVKFLGDLRRCPDKVQAAMDATQPVLIEMARQQLAAKPLAVWVGGWRGASEFISPKLWDRFFWPYFKQMVELVVEAGVIPVLHLDSSWTRDLARFRELPKGRCVFAPDGMTDIFEAKRVLGDHMCIMGDVPAAMLAVGSTQDVKAYVRRLITEVGPSGFILASGCDIPPNAKLENVLAMVEAVHEA